MRFKNQRESSNVEDQRGGASYARQTPSDSSDSETPRRTTPDEVALKKFTGQVLATTETCWHDALCRRNA